MTSAPRITSLRVQGLRTLADVRLPLGGLTVLIGANGTGKTSLLEALDLVQQAAEPAPFLPRLEAHGGVSRLLRSGGKALTLQVRVEGGGAPIDYSLELRPDAYEFTIAAETLDLHANESAQEPLHVIRRSRAKCEFFDQTQKKLVPLAVGESQLALTSFGAGAQNAVRRCIEALGRGRVHVPFEVRAEWVGEAGSGSRMRRPVQVRRTAELDRRGENLANCLHMLQSTPPHDWARTLERIQMGLPNVTRVSFPPAGRGEIEVALQMRGLRGDLPMGALSDGELSYLAFVALTQLAPTDGFLAFDEPETHLNPELLSRVVWLFEELAQRCPVILSTHSDRLLDALSDPAQSVILCELDSQHATSLLRAEPEMLAKWLERYRGVGQVIADGYAPQTFTRPIDAAASSEAR